MTEQPAPGTILRLAGADWRYGNFTLLLRVTRVRDDLARYYGGEWVWIEGDQLNRDGVPVGRVQALVRTAAIPGSVVRTPATGCG